MRWRPALAFAAVAVGAVLFSGAGPAWADGPTGAAGSGAQRVEPLRPGPHATKRVELPPRATQRVAPTRPVPRATERVELPPHVARRVGAVRPVPRATERAELDRLVQRRGERGHGLPNKELRPGASGGAAAHAQGGPSTNAKAAPPPTAPQVTDGAGTVPGPGRAVVRVAVGGAATGVQEASSRQGVRRTDPVIVPTATAVVSNPSVPGTGGGHGDGRNDAGSTGMAVGTVLLVGVGLIAAGIALVGLRNRRDTVDQTHGPGGGHGQGHG